MSIKNLIETSLLDIGYALHMSAFGGTALEEVDRLQSKLRGYDPMG